MSVDRVIYSFLCAEKKMAWMDWLKWTQTFDSVQVHCFLLLQLLKWTTRALRRLHWQLGGRLRWFMDQTQRNWHDFDMSLCQTVVGLQAEMPAGKDAENQWLHRLVDSISSGEFDYVVHVPCARSLQLYRWLTHRSAFPQLRAVDSLQLAVRVFHVDDM